MPDLICDVNALPGLVTTSCGAPIVGLNLRLVASILNFGIFTHNQGLSLESVIAYCDENTHEPRVRSFVTEGHFTG